MRTAARSARSSRASVRSGACSLSCCCGTARAAFNDIKRNTGGISQQMLTRTLRGLERDGIVDRTIFPTSPPQVEYRLTPLAPSMADPALAFGEWVLEHLAGFEAARRRFDAHQQNDAHQRAAAS